MKNLDAATPLSRKYLITRPRRVTMMVLPADEEREGRVVVIVV